MKVLSGSPSHKDATSKLIADKLDAFEESIKGDKKEVLRHNKSLQDIHGTAEETFRLLDALSNHLTTLENYIRSEQ